MLPGELGGEVAAGVGWVATLPAVVFEALSSRSLDDAPEVSLFIKVSCVSAVCRIDDLFPRTASVTLA
jgi:hypothetical protein